MTEDHLQFHWQLGSNSKESGGATSSKLVDHGSERLELKKLITEKNSNGEQFSSQLILQAQYKAIS